MVQVCQFKKGVRLIAKTSGVYKKICKIFFTKNDTSIYFHFYHIGNKYFFGKKEMKPTVAEIKFNFKKDGFCEEIPKISYHESGKIHLKTSLGKDLQQGVCVDPIKGENGNYHIMTAYIESLKNFENFENKDKRLRFFDVSNGRNINELKLLIYKIQGDPDLLKYKLGFVLGRRSPLRRVCFGMNICTELGMSKYKNGFIAITGWDTTKAVHSSNKAKLLYIVGE